MKTIVTLSLLASLLVGCAPAKPPSKSYSGPTDPMASVVAGINENNRAIPTLWSRTSFEATVYDEKKQSHFVSGEGALLYRAPDSFRLVGKHPVAGTVFDLGSTDDRYWVTLVPEVDTMWWGSFANLGKPCSKPIPLRPDLVMEVLGIGTINANFNELPAPVMRFNNDADAYMFVWVTKLGDHYAAEKEVWYDRRTKRPQRVYLFDENGRVVLRAFLGKHQQVEVADTPQDRWPWVATEYRLYFPDSKTTMSLELREVTLDRNGVPSRRGIVFPEEPGVSKVIQIDEGCH